MHKIKKWTTLLLNYKFKKILVLITAHSLLTYLLCLLSIIEIRSFESKKNIASLSILHKYLKFYLSLKFVFVINY